MPPRPTQRCFIAIPLDDVARADLAEAVDRSDLPGLRATKPPNLHLTIKFLGDVQVDHVDAVIEALRGAVAGNGPIELNVTGIDYIPNARRPRVLAAVLELPEALGLLVESIEEAFACIDVSRCR